MLPVVGNASRIVATFDCLKHLARAHQGQRLINLEALGEELVERCGELYSQFRRVKRLSVEDVDLDSVANLAREPVVARREIERQKPDPLNASRVQIVRQFPGINPRRAQHLERRVSAATNTEVGALDHPDARIESGLSQIAQVGRRVDPRKPRFVVPRRAAPVAHLDHLQPGAQMVFAVEHLRQLPNRHAVADGKREIANEGKPVLLQHRTLHQSSADGVRAVEHVEGNSLSGGRLERVAQSSLVGVKAHAGVLNVKHERVDALKHLVGGAFGVVVKAVDGQAGGRFFGRGDAVVGRAEKAMLGAEDGDQLDTARAIEQINGATAGAVASRVVGDQSDAVAAERREILRFQHVDAGLHVCLTKLLGTIAVRQLPVSRRRPSAGQLVRRRSARKGGARDVRDLRAQCDDVALTVRMDRIREQDDVGLGKRIDPDRRTRKAGVTKGADGKQVPAVRGVVRINIPAKTPH